ncbi:unnamed protein product [Orchesella dallaii]|uniref:Uncharacterized protein n=1 Tax=Orchesella dallaii TaxID=48710 RepID=A0ABP1QGB6_9HEXA
MRRGSLRDSRRHDRPILPSQKSEPILNWVPISSSLPNDAVSVQESADSSNNHTIYIGRPDKIDTSEFRLLPLRLGANGSHKEIKDLEILIDPQAKSEWKKITAKFDPKRYGALPANVEWKNEPNKFVGKVSWNSGIVTVGTILFEKPSWKLNYCLPSEFKEEYAIDMSQAVNSYVTFEVLCSK